MKTCARCSIEKPSNIEYFPKGGKSNLDGLSSWCKACYSEYRILRKADPLFKTTKKTGLPKPPKIPKIHKLPKIPRPPRGLVINGHKDCSRCKASLPICSFYPNPKVKSGLSSACKVCTAAYHRSRRPPKHPKRDLLRL